MGCQLHRWRINPLHYGAGPHHLLLNLTFSSSPELHPEILQQIFLIFERPTDIDKEWQLPSTDSPQKWTGRGCAEARRQKFNPVLPWGWQGLKHESSPAASKKLESKAEPKLKPRHTDRDYGIKYFKFFSVKVPSSILKCCIKLLFPFYQVKRLAIRA